MRRTRPAGGAVDAATEGRTRSAQSIGVDPALSKVLVTSGALASCADDVAQHCISAACPSAVQLGSGAVFVAEADVPLCRRAVADLLDAGLRKRDAAA